MLPWIVGAVIAFRWLYNKGVGKPTSKKPGLPASGKKETPPPTVPYTDPSKVDASEIEETVEDYFEAVHPEEKKPEPTKKPQPAAQKPTPELKREIVALPKGDGRGSLDDIMPDPEETPGVGVDELDELGYNTETEDEDPEGA